MCVYVWRGLEGSGKKEGFWGVEEEKRGFGGNRNFTPLSKKKFMRFAQVCYDPFPSILKKDLTG
jgi:hypothetical protein